ncbi:MAG: hypothetical protein K8R88_09285 [Armatimonadetes bacterium]|nr:hypothetical protein [Armatimonadota bacterium]
MRIIAGVTRILKKWWGMLAFSALIALLIGAFVAWPRPQKFAPVGNWRISAIQVPELLEEARDTTGQKALFELRSDHTFQMLMRQGEGNWKIENDSLLMTERSKCDLLRPLMTSAARSAREPCLILRIVGSTLRLSGKIPGRYISFSKT